MLSAIVAASGSRSFETKFYVMARDLVGLCVPNGIEKADQGSDRPTQLTLLGFMPHTGTLLTTPPKNPSKG